ncbi:MAG: hypothetical protein H7248_06150 [Microbacteriaceae bacterium]|nr:hypothetical protein [Microbacteriaceae bacterium]
MTTNRPPITGGGHHLDADLIIVGAGCAGLSLAARLADAHTSLRVLLIDPRTEYLDDRSWSFWRPPTHDLSRLVSTSWESWRFSDASGRSIRHSVAGLRYHYVRGADFYADALDRIAHGFGVTRLPGVRVDGLVSLDSGVRVDTDAGTLTARQVVDTRPRPAAALLYQSFAGVEIQSESPLPFETDEVGLMQSMTADAAGLGFVYTLPLTSHTALIEWTRFAAVAAPRSQLLSELDGVLAGLGLQEARVLRHEGGVLGMGLPRERSAITPGVVRAGTGGGALRAASGYGFLRMQRWAEHCAVRLLAGASAVGHPAEPPLRRGMDRLFLQAVRTHPERTADYFMALARGVAPARLVRFLNDGATLGDYANLIVALPTAPFIRELFSKPPVPSELVLPVRA